MKQIKDPIYGYINIHPKVMKDVIDTAEFQRLRRVVQTSYAPLYPSATHNRFVHSLGVYHLGQLAADSIEDNLSAAEKSRFSRYIELFKLACLLHDVGHAPFSHTGEEFYLDNRKYAKIHARLAEVIGNEALKAEFSRHEEKKAAAKPHEIMSSIVGIKLMASEFHAGNEGLKEKEFFARAICGYKYEQNVGDNSFKNELISLLNSNVIDVDKLDYLIRDSYLIGYQTVSIDYRRLVDGVKIKRSSDHNPYRLCYPKKSVSVFENVVYAHDLERKWIQNHPIVKYEMYLLKESMREVKDCLLDRGVKLFCEEALSGEGILLCGELRIRYMSDDDIIFLMKNFGGENAKKYARRSLWSKGIWKSDADYRALFGDDWKRVELGKFRTEVSNLLRSLKIEDEGCINEASLEKLERDYQACQGESEDAIVQNAKNIALHIKLCKALKQFAHDHEEMPFEYVIVRGKGFKSGFEKTALRKIRIELDVADSPVELGAVIPLLKVEGDSDDTSSYFNVFIPSGADSNRTQISKDFVKVLQDYAKEELAEVDYDV